MRRNREFLMLAIDFEWGKHRVGGMYLSEKMDGMRCVWIPETRGVKTTLIPWANSKKEFTATGLWSRYGHVIHCPPEYTKNFPTNILMDGELWLGRGGFQQIMSTCRSHDAPWSEWKDVRFCVFDTPTRPQLFRAGRINNQNYKHEFMEPAPEPGEVYGNFEQAMKRFQKIVNPGCGFESVPQILLPFMTDRATDLIKARLESVVAESGEGLMLRYPSSIWEPIRSKEIMKIKATKEGMGIVVGYIAGKGKHQGRLGSLRIAWGDPEKQFDLGGFTDEDRKLYGAASVWADSHPGELLPAGDVSYRFPIRSSVTFEYRELTDGGTPKEARFKA